MKNLFTLFLVLLASVGCYAFEASVDIFTFQTKDKSYIETYVRILKDEVKFIFNEEDKTYSSAVEVLIIIQANGKVYHFDKYQLNSPKSTIPQDYLDLKRYIMEEGKYDFSMELKDVNNPSNLFTVKRSLIVEAHKNKIAFSDIILLADKKQDAQNTSPLSKNGIYMEPIAFNYSDEKQDDLFFYSELYKSNPKISDSSFYIKYSIVSGYYGEAGKEVMTKYKRTSPAETIPLLLHFGIATLTSGNYHLLIEAYNNKKQQLTTCASNFIKDNPKADLAEIENYNESIENSFVVNIPAEKLDFHLKSLFPLIDSRHHNTHQYIVSKGSDRSKRAFIFKFWKEHADASPEAGFIKYAEVAEAVHTRFYNTVGYGFETDRGYIYLKYGKPDDVFAVEDEPNTPPYQIWLYHFVPQTNQSHVKFLFFNKSLVTNDFDLLHSTCRGEYQNEAWETLLYANSPEERLGNSIDGTSVGDNWVRLAKKHFNDF